MRKLEYLRRRAFKVSHKILLVSILCVLAACSSPQKIPGDDVYYIDFKPDWEVFESGTFMYRDNYTYQLGGSRGEYNQFYIMQLQFKLKNGRSYSESLDIGELVKQMAETRNVFDVRKTQWGGSATVVTIIKENKLELIYEVTQRIHEPFYQLRIHKYPLFEKELK